jgi:drug/metabolite transporter (DMT)-like permease
MTSPNRSELALGIAAGLAAASIAALYTVFARWGLAQGMQTWDLTFLRFGVAGIVMLPVVILAYQRDAQALLSRWRLWLLVSVLAGPLFGLLMFGALLFAPASHAAVFPFTAMSVMGLLLGAFLLGDRITPRKGWGIAVVVLGLVLISGIDLHSLQGRALLGDLLFVAAGSLWAGFGIVLRRHALPPVLTTAIISLSALTTYVPVYLALGGWQQLMQVATQVVLVEVVVQGLIAGAGTLYTYGKMVSLLGPSRAAVFPALAPGIAALLAWPVLGHVPTTLEVLGLLIVMTGLILAVTQAKTRVNANTNASSPPRFPIQSKA